MADFLTAMAKASRERPVVRAEDGPTTPVAPLRLDGGGFDLIAEAKLRGPASGRLTPRGDDISTVVGLARAFAEGGAAVVSVLTEPTEFDGTLGHLAAVAAAVEVPVMRKDFLVDPAQVVEARDHGASGVLLIARILNPGLLREMVDIAEGLGMFSLVEVFDQPDLAVASEVFDRQILVGVNSRDLTDLSVDGSRFESLAAMAPDGLTLVAESGIDSEDDIARVVSFGYRMALVGTSLVGVDDPRAGVEGLVAAGRAVAGSRTG